MIQKETLEMVVNDQRKELALARDEVPRQLAGAISDLRVNRAVIVKGVRRCGKSTLLRQVVRKKFGEDFYYLNFDDDRLLGFEAADFQGLMEAFAAVSGKSENLLLDEIQNVAGWELFVNRMLRQGFRVFITGSNANLLSRELGTHLTGRHADFELYPFSFSEWLSLKKIRVPTTLSTDDVVALSGAFGKYLHSGGFPEVATSGDPSLLGPVLDDIIQKDVIRRYSIRKPLELRNVVTFLLWNAANRMTFKAMASNFRIKSANTVQKYFEYCQETGLLFAVNKYDPKIKQYEKNPKKIYCADNGLITRNRPGTQSQQGQLLENLVAVELKRRGATVHYYQNRDGSETDFVLVDGLKKRITQALQVSTDISDFETRQREEKALFSTLEETGLKEGMILTANHEETRKSLGKTVTYAPVWKWMLGFSGSRNAKNAANQR